MPSLVSGIGHVVVGAVRRLTAITVLGSEHALACCNHLLKAKGCKQLRSAQQWVQWHGGGVP